LENRLEVFQNRLEVFQKRLEVLEKSLEVLEKRYKRKLQVQFQLFCKKTDGINDSELKTNRLTKWNIYKKL